MSTDDESLKLAANEYLKVEARRNEIHLDWLKNIVIIAVAMLTIIVTLKTEPSTNIYEKTLYLITICALGLGIPLSLISLYGHIHLLDSTLDVLLEYISMLQDEMKKNHVKNISLPKIYSIFEKLSLFLFVIALICLVAYALIIELNTCS